MALRTIADLPALDVDKILENKEQLQKNLSESIFEISYMETYEYYDTYRSMHIKFKDLTALILDNIANYDFDFYGYKMFYGGIGVSNILELTGNFYVNRNVENYAQYEAIINAGNIAFNSYNMSLSSERLTAYAYYGTIMNYDGTQTIVNWDCGPNTVNKYFQFNVPLYAENISCNHLTANGDSIFNGVVTFSQVIQGCALCAKWADLAELYKSDADYEPGTLVRFGGDAEITIADKGRANAVITDQPGLILNGSGDRDGIYKGIALIGRTPVRVSGPVSRFDRLAVDPFHAGVACKANESDQAIAVAFGDVPAGEVRLVECAVQLKL